MAEALGTGNPLDLLALVSGLVDVLAGPRSALDPRDPELPSVATFVDSFVEVPGPDTTAVLAVLAALLPDELAARSARRELARRHDALPSWLAWLDRAAPGRVVEVADVLGDASNVMVEAVLADGQTLTVVALLDHAAGSAVGDGFVIPDGIDAILRRMGDTTPSSSMTVTDLDPAVARVRLEEGVRHGTMFVPPFESDTWPAARPLVLWGAGLLPEGGELPERPEWSEDDEEALIGAFLASEEGRGFDDDDHRDLLETLVWLGTGYGSGDPLRWSPNRVAELLLDLVPRKVMAEPTHLAKVPTLLRALVGYGHRERGIPTDLTADTLDAIEQLRPEYEEAITDPGRPRGAEALALQALSLTGASSPALQDLWARELAQIVERAGGPEALASLDTAPLPDEPLDLTGVPEDVLDRVREVAALCDEACDALLGVEARTACRRLVARVGRDGPDAFRRKGRSDTAAAALCWVVGRAGDRVGPDQGQVSAKSLLAHFGLTASVASRAGALLRAAGFAARSEPWTALPPEMILADGRRAMLLDAGRFRMLLAGAEAAGAGPEPGPPTLFPASEPAPPPSGPAGDAPTRHRLKVTLQDIRPPIWRRLEVDSATTLAELHDVLQVAFGWSDSHLHAFTVGDRSFVPAPMVDEWSPWGAPATDEATVTVADVLAPGVAATYTYDFGDGWEHTIEVEATASDGADVDLPRCTGGRRAGPPEDVGGAWGYGHLLEVLADPTHPEHDDQLEWLGGPFDPERFDAQEITRRLRGR
ncbi:MAG TPA: DUF6398 domain-containing protein [Iamia sp.]|nr:DUF6398 domain-containing protein [Iamia sp.]